ncbi:hypothetical protein AKO1_015325 [Acrasis kona]|uniref:Uncharacterized protein n=1 Tax=Acrasis kona TaxID=1008807 RepID=A0AAW2Z040_9EUKA
MKYTACCLLLLLALSVVTASDIPTVDKARSSDYLTGRREGKMCSPFDPLSYTGTFPAILFPKPFYMIKDYRVHRICRLDCEMLSKGTTRYFTGACAVRYYYFPSINLDCEDRSDDVFDKALALCSKCNKCT